MGKKKANPKMVHHLSDMELRKMEAKWTHNASTLALCAFLSVMHDKEGYGAKRLKRVYDNVEKLSQEITEGRLNLKDIRDAMLEEIGVELVL